MKALLAARDAELAARDGAVQRLRDRVSTLAQAPRIRSLEIEQLKPQIARLWRMQIGRKAGRMDRQFEQVEIIRLEDLIAEEGAAQGDAQREVNFGVRWKSTRQPLPGDLTREDHVFDPVAPSRSCNLTDAGCEIEGRTGFRHFCARSYSVIEIARLDEKQESRH